MQYEILTKVRHIIFQASLQGEIVDPGSTNLGINKNSFSVHSAIHAFRPDIKSIIHVQTPNTTAVSLYVHYITKTVSFHKDAASPKSGVREL